MKNPPKHIPKFYDLLECIDFNDREEEFLARFITNNVETNGKLYTKTEELENFTNIHLLIAKYNSKLYTKHKDSEIKYWHGNYYIKSYEDDAIYIINKLKELSQHGMDDYENIANNWLDFNQYDSDSRRIDDECKKDIIRKLFSKSSVALIYGVAGTGKSTLIKYISELFNDKNRIYIAQTNPAVQNIEKKVELAKNLTQTITKFLKNPTECDILFIDECSTISNKTMKEILEKANFKQLILIGDNFQIESIQYGSWFDIARNFITEKNGAIFELTTPYRTKDKELLAYWQEVRNIKKDEENKIIELDSHAKFSKPLNDEIFKEPADDEVILCLNYDGLYGVNNINKFLQIMNKNELIKFGIYGFKVGDPILFMENNYFVSNLHNNLKGKIKKIEQQIDDNGNIYEIYFEVEVERTFDSSSLTYGLTLLEQYENSSLVGFSVDTFTDNESDNENAITIPFQLGYAISIHKSQGLEFKSVKIIITNEIEEKISHNIFYTAITRAKEKLTIFWSPEVMNRVIESFIIKNNKIDLSILRTKNNI
nr:AAA family ATPase [Campylobacter sp.]